MRRTSDQQTEQILDERREQIKKAALKVFAYRGVAGTKMSMIADEAGISQGLSYRYFSSKEEIFTELVKEALEESHKAMGNVSSLPGTPIQQIRAFTLNMLDESNKLYFLLLQQVQKSDGVPVSAKQIVEEYSTFSAIDQLIPIIAKGQETGDFSEGDPQKILFLYLSVVTGLMLQDVQIPKGYWLQEVDNLLKILAK